MPWVMPRTMASSRLTYTSMTIGMIMGLRRAVSARTLDELLGDKASLDADILADVRGKVDAFGVEVIGVGIKDVILPGEMREILNAVVQAEKAAQANVIRRAVEIDRDRGVGDLNLR